VWAPPGTYSIELDVDGRTYRQPLQLKADPRVKVSDAAMQREFVLARKVEAALTQATTAGDEAVELLKRLQARPAHVDAALQTSIDALLDKAAALSGMEAHPDPRNSMGRPPQRTDSLRALSIDLRKLEQAVDGADADPSADAQTSYTSLSQTLAATLAGWQQLKQQDLAALNAKLKAAGDPAIAL
jgi:hypothetical protein